MHIICMQCAYIYDTHTKTHRNTFGATAVTDVDMLVIVGRNRRLCLF